MSLSIVLGSSLLVVSIFLVWTLLRSRHTADLLLKQQIDSLQEKVELSSRSAQEQAAELARQFGAHLQKNLEFVQEANRHVGQRLDNAARVVGEVQNKLGKMEEATDRVFEIGKSLSTLQEILRAPKLRGSLGELFLGDLLAQVLPKEAYELQYTFKGGEKVDALIRTAHGMISVDAKFPLENFRRVLEAKTDEERKTVRKSFLQDVKKHVEAISKKYILPDEGTLDIALMYVPAENVYYEILIKGEEGEPDLLRFAQERRVFPVSPNSFYAYLQTISIGLRGMQMEKGIREVHDHLQGLRKEFDKFGDTFSLIGTHLGNALGSFEKADRQFQRLGGKLETIGLEEEGRGELRVLKGGDEA